MTRLIYDFQNIPAQNKEWCLTIIKLAYFILGDKMICFQKRDLQGQPTESEQSVESCSSEFLF